MRKLHKDPSTTSFISKIIDITRYYWELITNYYRLIKLARFSVFIALIVILFVLVPQGTEALIVMQENANDYDSAQLINFVLFNFILALMCWYYARILYFFAFKDEASHAGQYCKFKKHFPRLLGVSMIFIPALVVIFTESIENSLFWYLLVSSTIFLLFVY
ncbi:hypothetical protein MNBD_GAMMA01-910, partial [hydrothermal vent metagenome]